MLGSSVPLPRAAIEARYGDREGYCRLARLEAERMVRERHLLEEDVGRVVARAAAAYDAFASA